MFRVSRILRTRLRNFSTAPRPPRPPTLYVDWDLLSCGFSFAGGIGGFAYGVQHPPWFASGPVGYLVGPPLYGVLGAAVGFIGFYLSILFIVCLPVTLPVMLYKNFRQD